MAGDVYRRLPYQRARGVIEETLDTKYYHKSPDVGPIPAQLIHGRFGRTPNRFGGFRPPERWQHRRARND